jgi:hypothetical protein
VLEAEDAEADGRVEGLFGPVGEVLDVDGPP